MQTQLQLFSPAEEAYTYHAPTRQGFFSLLIGNGEDSGKKQESYRLSQMPMVLILARLPPGYLAISGRVLQAHSSYRQFGPYRAAVRRSRHPLPTVGGKGVAPGN